jgi:hypothetical protein
MHPPLNGSPPAVRRQRCRHCQTADIHVTIETASVVYFRCDKCGCVWSIQERRSGDRRRRQQSSTPALQRTCALSPSAFLTLD